MDAILDQVPIGLAIGTVLLLAALGLNFTFGQTGVINMAHGEFTMVGACTAFVIHAWFGLDAAYGNSAASSAVSMMRSRGRPASAKPPSHLSVLHTAVASQHNYATNFQIMPLRGEVTVPEDPAGLPAPA
ncbi:hypothetical protein LP52_06860 [Streptomonospora alba]|uniref:Branched-chain amino acid ABC transporter permease n=1 Tax=Streptomonospora alba TaxID=183763 RepID=A0A0C2JDW9_9ACTN|nr:hypothetical protein [Streptomonospora alba]KIH99586.1 hypothetical protein LP52_06860 [Streptomonospora alba]